MKIHTPLVILASLTLSFAGCAKHSSTAGLPKNSDSGVNEVSGAAKNTDLLGKTNSYFPMRFSNFDGATLVDLGLVKISSRVTNWYALASNKSLSITAGQMNSYLGRVPIRFEVITTNAIMPHEVSPRLTIQTEETELTPERTNILSLGNLMISLFPLPTEQFNAKK